MFLWQKVYVFYRYMSGNNAMGGLPRGFDLLDGAEYFVHLSVPAKREAA